MGSDTKKDLTGIFDLPAEEMAQPGPDSGFEPVMEQAPLEQIDDFESLDSLGQMDHPTSGEPSPEFPESNHPEHSTEGNFSGEAAVPSSQDDPFAVTPDSASDSELNFSGGVAESENFESAPANEINGDFAPSPEFDGSPDSASTDFAPSPDPNFSAEAHSSGLAGEAGFSTDPSAGFDSHSVTPAAPAPQSTPKSTPKSTMEQVKQYAEKTPIGKPAVQAQFPFSLLITGKLAPEEQEKLMDVIHRHQMGFTEMDLEPQFQAGRVLIPRISEYAGILLVQAMRGTSARMKFAPSDEIFATDDTRTSEDELVSYEPATNANQAVVFSVEQNPEAENLPITPGSTLSGSTRFTVVDAVTASATLNCREVETDRSTEYQEALDALQRELKYKAFRKGANAIVNFTVTLTPLNSRTHYRLTVLGSAIKTP